MSTSFYNPLYAEGALCKQCPGGVFRRHVTDRPFVKGEKVHRAKVHKVNQNTMVTKPSLMVEESNPRYGRLSASGRPRLGKTHQPSKEAKARRNRARNHKRGRYRFCGVDLLHNILEVGFVPLERYKYHEARYRKAGRPFTLKQAWGFRLRNMRRFDLPDIVVSALVKMYSVPVVKQPKARKVLVRERTPRKRTRSDSLLRTFRMLASVGSIEQRPGLAWRLAGEVACKRNRCPDYEVPVEIQTVLAEAFRSKKVDKPTKLAIRYCYDQTFGHTYEYVIGGKASLST